MEPAELAAAALRWLGVREGAESPDTAVAGDVAAGVVEFLAKHPGTDWITDPVTGERSWRATTRAGATMLTARLIRRRNSAGGVEAVTDVGIAYVGRTDPDVALLLNMGSHARPKVG